VRTATFFPFSQDPCCTTTIFDLYILCVM
jgi:hypothetical protein